MYLLREKKKKKVFQGRELGIGGPVVRIHPPPLRERYALKSWTEYREQEQKDGKTE